MTKDSDTAFCRLPTTPIFSGRQRIFENAITLHKCMYLYKMEEKHIIELEIDTLSNSMVLKRY